MSEENKTVGDYFSKHQQIVGTISDNGGTIAVPWGGGIFTNERGLQIGTPLGEREIPYGLLPDWAIKRYIPIFNADETPVDWDLKQEGVISYGVCSAGFDARLGNEFKKYKTGRRINPKNVTESDVSTFRIPDGSLIELQPKEFILAHTVEIFHVPDDVKVVCVGKSTYARCAILVTVTPLEPAWHGQVTLEIYNQSENPVILFPGEGICQFEFHRIARPDVTYADRKGKYMDQRGVVLPRVK